MPERRDAQRQALLSLLQHSLARGHRKLVLRRYLMLCWQGHPVPDRMIEACNRIVVASPAREFACISRQVRAWQRMLGEDAAAADSAARRG